MQPSITVINAQVQQTSFYGQPHTNIAIKLNIGSTPGHDSFVYDLIKIDNTSLIHTSLIRGEAGDIGSFYALTSNNNGFGGSLHTFLMHDGTLLKHRGPWSSRAGVINALFANNEPLVECVNLYQHVVTYVKKSALERFNIKLERIAKHGEISFKPVI